LITIVMPVYNAASFLDESIVSVLEQTFGDWELLICDDASSDGSGNKLSKYKDTRLRCFKNNQNQGYLRSCNMLMERARGVFLTFQDADDVSHPQRLQKLLDFFVENPDYSLCGSQVQYFRHDKRQPVRDKLVATDYQNILRGLKERSHFSGASVMVRTDVMRQVGYYRPWFDRIGSEDYDCFYRIAEQYKVANLPEVLYYVRITSGSISRTIRNHRQLISSDVVRFLAKQRAETGRDSLSGAPIDLLNDHVEDLVRPFILDRGLVYRRAADVQAFSGLYWQAVANSARAVSVEPFRLINYKYFFSLIVQALVHSST
jgi:glycosyltransferase involved in cell wall biosynthesis